MLLCQTLTSSKATHVLRLCPCLSLCAFVAVCFRPRPCSYLSSAIIAHIGALLLPVVSWPQSRSTNFSQQLHTMTIPRRVYMAALCHNSRLPLYTTYIQPILLVWSWHFRGMSTCHLRSPLLVPMCIRETEWRKRKAQEREVRRTSLSCLCGNYFANEHSQANDPFRNTDRPMILEGERRKVERERVCVWQEREERVGRWYR
jgi:hypothetical protein